MTRCLAATLTLWAAACSGAPEVDAGITPDAESSDAEPQDAALDAGAIDSGSGDGGPLVASLDRHCRYFERVGLLEINTYGGTRRDLRLSLFADPDPWLGPPQLSDAVCEFHRFVASCGDCGPDRVCGVGGQCAPYPAPIDGITVQLDSASGTQTLSGDSGSVGGEITLAEASLGISVRAPGIELTLAPTSLPEELAGIDGTLGGTYDAPTSVDVTWDPPVGPGQVFSHVPMNHHVGGPTFTECLVPAAAGQLHIDGAMLAPLALATGLEFQGIQHVRFAAVDTSFGCFELRFSRYYSVNLF